MINRLRQTIAEYDQERKRKAQIALMIAELRADMRNVREHTNNEDVLKRAALIEAGLDALEQNDMLKAEQYLKQLEG